MKRKTMKPVLAWTIVKLDGTIAPWSLKDSWLLAIYGSEDACRSALSLSREEEPCLVEIRAVPPRKAKRARKTP